MWNGETFQEGDRDLLIVSHMCAMFQTKYVACGVGQVEQWHIMLLGHRGVGKSSTGNTILGHHSFNTDMQLARVIQQCTRADASIQGRPVAVIDTTSLKKTKHMEKKVLQDILKSMLLCKPGLHAFLLEQPIGNLTSMFGKRVWEYTIIIFTHGDRLERMPDDVIIIVPVSDKALREFIRCSSRGFMFFKNMKSCKQVVKLMEKIKTLVAINGRKYCTTVLYLHSERKV
uniref:AIG1-type G domain-containing protein n=1 Tax=Electrophorus electricus TaxID=8005 RepID=A0A4W4FF41_ELEEL